MPHATCFWYLLNSLKPGQFGFAFEENELDCLRFSVVPKLECHRRLFVSLWGEGAFGANGAVSDTVCMKELRGKAMNAKVRLHANRQALRDLLH